MDEPSRDTELLQLPSLVRFNPSLGQRRQGAGWGQAVEARVECSAAQVDLMFALDGSGSIGAANWENIRQFVANVGEAVLVAEKPRDGSLDL